MGTFNRLKYGQTITDTTIAEAITTAVSLVPTGTTALDINLSLNRITRSGLSILLHYLSTLTTYTIQSIDLSINGLGSSDVSNVYSTAPAPTIDPSIIKL